MIEIIKGWIVRPEPEFLKGKQAPFAVCVVKSDAEESAERCNRMYEPKEKFKVVEVEVIIKE